MASGNGETLYDNPRSQQARAEKDQADYDAMAKKIKSGKLSDEEHEETLGKMQALAKSGRITLPKSFAKKNVKQNLKEWEGNMEFNQQIKEDAPISSEPKNI